MQDLAKKVKKLRELLGVTATELAKRSNLSLAYISKLENGEYKTLSLTSSKSLAEGLGLTLHDFLEFIGFLSNQEQRPSSELLSHALRRNGYSDEQVKDVVRYAEYIKSHTSAKGGK